MNAVTRDGRPTRSERIVVVRTVDELQRAVAVRAIVYMAGQDCPYDEEFDGNDLCGLHLLGWVGDEPAASLRLRFFAGFVKVERLAVRPEFRASSIAFRIVRHGLRLAARKGYRKAYGHAREGLEAFWARFGARAIGPAGAFRFSGHRYTEMELDLPHDPLALAIGGDPLVLIRPEGDWDGAGILERARPPGDAPADAGPDGSGEHHRSSWTGTAEAAWRGWARGYFEEEAPAYCHSTAGVGGLVRDFNRRMGRDGAARRSDHDPPATRRQFRRRIRGRSIRRVQIAGRGGAPRAYSIGDRARPRHHRACRAGARVTHRC